MKYFLYKYTRFPFAKLELYDILTLCSSSAGNRVFREGVELTFKIIEIKLKIAVNWKKVGRFLKISNEIEGSRMKNFDRNITREQRNVTRFFVEEIKFVETTALFLGTPSNIQETGQTVFSAAVCLNET